MDKLKNPEISRRTRKPAIPAKPSGSNRVKE
jgi:hypothetical protein